MAIHTDTDRTLVDSCKWVTSRQPDGSSRPVRLGDCLQPTCHYSKNYNKRSSGTITGTISSKTASGSNDYKKEEPKK
ncbi:hypothetical protein F4777DRAFT_579716 [Nemania sp. FL0916]|nr:hypothetical protein F4777DRAFT_579716 [Nemania sp. FL0916]